MNKLHFGEPYDDIDDNGARYAKVCDADSMLGTFTIQQTTKHWCAWLKMRVPTGEWVFEEFYPTKTDAVRGCQEFYEGQALGLLQEAFGSDDDIPLILTADQARHIYHALMLSASGMTQADELIKAMNEQGVTL